MKFTIDVDGKTIEFPLFSRLASYLEARDNQEATNVVEGSLVNPVVDPTRLIAQENAVEGKKDTEVQ